MKKLLLFVITMSSFAASAQFWSDKATGFTTANRTLSGISIVDTNVIWAIALDNSATPDYTIKEFTKSTDGGETWTSGTINLGANTTGLGITSISAVSDNIAFISAAPETGDLGGIWKTVDGGLSWAKLTTALFSNPIESYTNFVHFWDASSGVAGGDTENGTFEIYTTLDAGATWTRVVGANIPASLVDEIGFLGMTAVAGNTFWFGTSAGRIFKSNDKGLTWTVAQSPSTDFNLGLDKFTFSDANNGLLMNYYNTTALYKTTDGGTNWISVATSGFFNTNIAYIPGTSKVISAASATPLGSSYSLDNGLTWTTIDTGVFHGTLAFLNDSFGFSAGFNTNATTGGISKYTGIVLKNPSFNSNYEISAYPNPTKGILYLKSGTASIKEASVFDLLGKEVYKANFSKLNNINLDLKSLETGVYLLKVTSVSGKTETIKIMKN
ncbi:T9SS type A sorting domain-containing protein [Flavobacterium sp.]|uniref:T9SS type A sorting domain-containing protein n=1 Tax=Flavobacterium sp. TaxID=239 RepID=UPI00286DC7A2|nr:T9SS type A sorting domain-containing protein [Flavobacterium sp.]